METKITVHRLCKLYNVEYDFISELLENDLLTAEKDGEEIYIIYEELPVFERFVRWKYDLDINVPGIQIMQDLLSKIDRLTAENQRLHALHTQYHRLIYSDPEDYAE